MKKYRIAVIPGDGIGTEVMPEGVRVLDNAAAVYGFELDWTWFEFSSCAYYQRHGRMLPENWFELLSGFDAIYFGAVGWPETVPDHVSLWGSLLLFRREFEQYVNLRPVRLLPGIRCPLADRRPGDIDFVVVRENTEGEYKGLEHEVVPGVVTNIKVVTRAASQRIAKFAFNFALANNRRLVTACHKANVMYVLV